MEWFKQTPALRQFETLILNGKVKILSIFTWVLLNLRWHILHLVKSSSKQLKFVCFAILECTLDVVVIKSSRSEVFCEKDVLRNFAKFIGKHLCQSLFFNKVAGLRPATLLKKRLWHRCFPVSFTKFLRTPFISEHPQWLLLGHRHWRDVQDFFLCHFCVLCPYQDPKKEWTQKMYNFGQTALFDHFCFTNWVNCVNRKLRSCTY